ncbi:hypothetical protein M9458_057558, partial [Cirrhinus mrigala]
MAHLIYRLHDRWAFRRERIKRDRTNPLDVFRDRELIERFCFRRVELLELINELSPQLQHVTDRNGALSPILQVLISLRFYAGGSFQNTFADMVNVSRSTTCRAIRRVSLALQNRVQKHVRLPTQEEATRTKDKFRKDSGISSIFGCID